MIVFLDTNIIFSAVLFPNSTPDKALQKCLLSERYEAITSDYCINELERVFTKKFEHKVNYLNTFLDVFLSQVHLVNTSNTVIELESKIRDPKDRPVLRAAIENNADIIISGDKDLLESDIKKPKIITANEFYNFY